MSRELRPSDGINTALDDMELPPSQAMGDRLTREAELKQLRARNRAMLPRRQPKHPR